MPAAHAMHSFVKALQHGKRSRKLRILPYTAVVSGRDPKYNMMTDEQESSDTNNR